MSSISPRLGLNLPDTIDDFSTDVLKANWQAIDDAPGTFICTSAERLALSWGAGRIGRKVYETNTGLEWVWQGSTLGWARAASSGMLKLAGGGVASATRSTEFLSTAASPTWAVIISLTGVVIPAGNRPLLLNFFRDLDQAYGGASPTNSNGTEFYLRFFRSSVAGSTPIGWQWYAGSESGGSGNFVRGGSDSLILPSGIAAGTYNFSVQAQIPVGVTTPHIRIANPITFEILEL